MSCQTHDTMTELARFVSALCQVIGTVFVAGISILAVAGAANYSGMCIAQLRYLSAAEKVDAAVSFVLDRGWLPHDGQPADRRYESAEQYLTLVPNCCVVDIEFVGGSHFLSRVLGRLSDYVSIANVSRATAEAASPQELSAILGSLRDNQHYFIAVSNCGRGWDWTD